MSTFQTHRRPLQTTLALAALAVGGLVAPAASAVAAPARPQPPPRLAHLFTLEAVLPNDPHDRAPHEKGGEPR